MATSRGSDPEITQRSSPDSDEEEEEERKEEVRRRNFVSMVRYECSQSQIFKSLIRRAYSDSSFASIDRFHNFLGYKHSLIIKLPYFSRTSGEEADKHALRVVVGDVQRQWGAEFKVYFTTELTRSFPVRERSVMEFSREKADSFLCRIKDLTTEFHEEIIKIKIFTICPGIVFPAMTDTVFIHINRILSRANQERISESVSRIKLEYPRVSRHFKVVLMEDISSEDTVGALLGGSSHS